MSRFSYIFHTLLAPMGHKYDWYVDSVNGDDANDGKSQGAAFATISALESAGIAEGEKIGLACGSHWDEQLDITVDGVMVEAYGSGAKPLLDCADEIAAENWSATGGRVNVYEATVTADLDGNTAINAWENGTYLERVADVATCDATAGSYYPSSDAVSPFTLYIHPNGSTDPTSDGKTYSVSARKYGICGTGDRITINGIHSRRNAHDDGSIKLSGADCAIRNCQCDDGNLHNLFIGASGVVSNTSCTDAYDPSGGNPTPVVGFVGAGSGEPITFTDCAVTFGASLPSNIGTTIGFYAHVGAGTLGTLTYTRCTVDNCDVGCDVAGSPSLAVFTNCQVDDGGIGIRTASDITILTSTYDNATGGGRVISATAAVSITATELNVRLNANTQAIYSGAAVTLDLRDSTLVNDGAANRAIYLTNAAATVYTRRNAYSGWAFAMDLGFASDAGSHDCDYNCFEEELQDHKFSDVQYNNITDYKAGQTQDQNSTVGSCDLSAAPS